MTASRILAMNRAGQPEPGSWHAAPLGFDLAARQGEIDQVALRRWRLQRLRAELRRHDYAGAVLSDPMNIRYATGTRNMAVWTMHAPGRYAFVATEGPVVLFDFSSTHHLIEPIDTIDELRGSTPWFYFLAGPRTEEKTAIWADEVATLVQAHCGSNRRLAVDRCEPWGAQRLIARGLQLFDAQEPLERARAIKSPDEIKCLRLAIEVADTAIDRMRAALEPGITENQLWSILHETNIAHDGEWIECRLLASGERTNPWFQECGNRVIQAGDLVGFDTDMVGPNGYLADISRTYVCPGRAPTNNQTRLHAMAQEQVLTNMALLRPGLSFREFVERAWKMPDEFVPNRYMVQVHGVGFVDEYPAIACAADVADWGYDGMFEENMVVSVESYLGETGGTEGVKLEQQVLITASGAEVLSRTPFEDSIVP
jgi:Xaa-Pro aminopeptidase